LISELYTGNMDSDKSHMDGEKLSEFLSEGESGVEWQAGRLTFKKCSGKGGHKGGGIRGRVTVMSSESRRRLMGKFASIDFVALAASKTPIHFVTLTTPMEYWTRQKDVYLAVRRFREWMQYNYSHRGYLGGFCRRELGGKRGMLHYHLILFGCDSLAASAVSKAWSAALRYDGRVRVDVQHPESAVRVGKYLSKYCSKVGYEGKTSAPEGATNTLVGAGSPSGADAPLSKAHNGGNTYESYTGGRWWYVWGEENLPWGESMTFTGDFGKALGNRVRRIFRRWLAEKVRSRWIADCKKKGLWHSPTVRRQVMGFSVKQLTKYDRFAEYLSRGGGGYSLFASPELLQQMVDCASWSMVESHAGA